MWKMGSEHNPENDQMCTLRKNDTRRPTRIKSTEKRRNWETALCGQQADDCGFSSGLGCLEPLPGLGAGGEDFEVELERHTSNGQKRPLALYPAAERCVAPAPAQPWLDGAT
jgi:hypothetical protein